jgi:hypothetical protein
MAHSKSPGLEGNTIKMYAPPAASAMSSARKASERPNSTLGAAILWNQSPSIGAQDTTLNPQADYSLR